VYISKNEYITDILELAIVRIIGDYIYELTQFNEVA
jgi:hypothetical protein